MPTERLAAATTENDAAVGAAADTFSANKLTAAAIPSRQIFRRHCTGPLMEGMIVFIILFWIEVIFCLLEQSLFTPSLRRATAKVTAFQQLRAWKRPGGEFKAVEDDCQGKWQ